MTARNLQLKKQGDELRCAVRAIMAARPRLARQLTAKEVFGRLPPKFRRRGERTVSERTISGHIKEIHDEAELQELLDCRDGNSSPESDAA